MSAAIFIVLVIYLPKNLILDNKTKTTYLISLMPSLLRLTQCFQESYKKLRQPYEYDEKGNIFAILFLCLL